MKKNHTIFTSIIIPCLNEEKFIKRCLDSLIKNRYSQDNLEILVYDGGSTDRTKEIVEGYEKKFSFIKLRNNPKKFPCFALNKGIEESKGEIIIRCDAHASYPPDYIKKIVSLLQSNREIGNVGGVCINEPANNTIKAKGISYTLSHFFCIGPNKFRKGVKKSSFVDTVPFGAWRREIFEKVGLFNEKFLKAEDLEFNIRLRKAGYKILLVPDIKISYYPRENFSKLFKMMFQYGYWKNFVNKELKLISSIRQLAPPLFVLYIFSLIFLPLLSGWFFIPLVLYFVLVLLFSFTISVRKKDIRIYPFCCLTFIVSHIGYGLGYLKGFWDIWIIKKRQISLQNTEITR